MPRTQTLQFLLYRPLYTMKLQGLCLWSKPHQKDVTENRLLESARNNKSLTNQRDIMSHQREKWVENTSPPPPVPPVFIFWGLSIFCLKMLSKFQEIYPQASMFKNYIYLQNTCFAFDWERTFLIQTFFPSPYQHKFLLYCGLFSTCGRAWKSLSDRYRLLVTDTRFLLTQVHGSCH